MYKEIRFINVETKDVFYVYHNPENHKIVIQGENMESQDVCIIEFELGEIAEFIEQIHIAIKEAKEML